MELVTVDEVFVIHSALVAQTDEPDGALTPGLVQAAVERAAWGPVDGNDDIFARAAFYARLAEDHPFAEGNKRTAIAVTDTFLRLNGYRLSASEERLKVFILDVAQGRFGERQIAAWLRANSQKV